jgi:acetylornithine deacetylase/succinyl-diaminopimelate desuccinylase-like protein
VVAFATDIPHCPRGVSHSCSARLDHVAHRDDEHVAIAELHAAALAYERIVDSLLSR